MRKSSIFVTTLGHFCQDQILKGSFTPYALRCVVFATTYRKTPYLKAAHPKWTNVFAYRTKI